MKYTNLDMVQEILSSLGSDEVNSVGDTTESLQVLHIVRQVYFNMANRMDLPEHKDVFSLTASADALLPVLMYKPDNVARIEWLKYNTEEINPIDNPVFTYVTILPFPQFLEMINRLNPDEPDVGTYQFAGYTLYYKNDQMPCFCTVLEDYNILFDSVDLDIDTTLQSSKTLCFGLKLPTFTMTDSFVPNLDDHQFPLLLNEAKSLAFLELKQIMHQKAEQEATRQWRTLQRTKKLTDVLNSFDQLPNFGRPRAQNRSPNRWMRERA